MHDCCFLVLRITQSIFSRSTCLNLGEYHQNDGKNKTLNCERESAKFFEDRIP